MMKKQLLMSLCVISSALFAAEATMKTFDFEGGKIQSEGTVGFVRDNSFKPASAVFEPGLHGNALALDKQEVAFPVKGLVTPQKGAVSFWFKPINWSQGAEEFLPVFAIDTGHGHGWKMLCSYNNRPDKEPCGFFTILLFSQSEKILVTVQMPTHKNLLWGDWNHLVISWDASSVSLSFNGKQYIRKELPKDFVMMKPHSRDCVVIMPAAFWKKTSEVKTLVDDVTFFSEPLDQEASAAIFSAR